MQYRTLDLRSPLKYEAAPELSNFCWEPFAPPLLANEPPQELLFCFELDKEQAERIDPLKERFLGDLVFSGKSGAGQGNILLPAGLYLFVQRRGTLNREECIDMAIEQQKDGLWERLRPESRLYIRRLFEDNSQVTQLFRPCLGSPQVLI